MMLLTPTLWNEAMAQIESSIGSEQFSAWLKDLQLEDIREDGSIVLSAPNEFYAKWIKKKYHEAIEEGFGAVLDRVVEVDVVAGEGSPAVQERQSGDSTETRRFSAGSSSAPAATNGHSRAAQISQPTLVPEPAEATPSRARSVPPPKLNPRYSFDEFVVGESNRFAQAAASTVADPNGKGFNPLFIYGGVGLGKTHLMHAIGHQLYKRDPSTRVLYVTSEQFINSFIESIQNKRHNEFRSAYRNVDLLLIDDVQFLTGKERTQQEFFHTFNTLYDAGKKVVVTSDKPPKELSTLEDRLRSRFDWGLIVDIAPPDLETRVAILRKKAAQEGIRLPADVALFIAERMKQNVREMEGALKRLSHAATLHSAAIDLEMARDILSHLMIGTPVARVTVEDVQRAVCDYFKVKMQDLLGANRSKRFSQPRHLAQYLSRKLTDLSFPDIAQKFGGKDHTSIIYACRKVEQAVGKDPNLANVIEHLTKQITKGSDQ
ncbi:chromosomal replication initiator protein DnaA [bacterium]|nr:chromosomal replication initiator protein DnaA [bacterium]